MSVANGTRLPRYLADSEAPYVSSWIPLGAGDRLYVESRAHLPPALTAELELYARAMRLAVARYGLPVGRIEVAPWASSAPSD